MIKINFDISYKNWQQPNWSETDNCWSTLDVLMKLVPQLSNIATESCFTCMFHMAFSPFLNDFLSRQAFVWQSYINASPSVDRKKTDSSQVMVRMSEGHVGAWSRVGRRWLRLCRWVAGCIPAAWKTGTLMEGDSTVYSMSQSQSD